MQVYPESAKTIISAIQKQYAVDDLNYIPEKDLYVLYTVLDVLRVKHPLCFHCLCDLLVGLLGNNTYVCIRNISMLMSAFANDPWIQTDITPVSSVHDELVTKNLDHVTVMQKFVSMFVFASGNNKSLNAFMSIQGILKNLDSIKRGKTATDRKLKSFVMEGFDTSNTYLQKLR